MIRLLAPLPAPEIDTLRVDGERLHYLTRVLRLTPGAGLQVFDGAGHVRAATLERIEPDHAWLKLGEPITAAQGAPITIVQAMPKGEKLEWILQKGTELGAAGFVLADSRRAVVKLDPRKADDRLKRWRKIVEEAARQCGRADVPSVDGPVPLVDCARGLPTGTRVLILDEEERQTRLATELARDDAPVALVIGPEGGLDREEVQALVSRGATPVTLGVRVLRTETASVAALAVALHVRGELG